MDPLGVRRRREALDAPLHQCELLLRVVDREDVGGTRVRGQNAPVCRVEARGLPRERRLRLRELLEVPVDRLTPAVRVARAAAAGQRETGRKKRNGVPGGGACSQTRILNATAW